MTDRTISAANIIHGAVAVVAVGNVIVDIIGVATAPSPWMSTWLCAAFGWGVVVVYATFEALRS